MPVFALALPGRSHSCRVRGPEICMSVFTLALQGRSRRTRVRGPALVHCIELVLYKKRIIPVMFYATMSLYETHYMD